MEIGAPSAESKNGIETNKRQCSEALKRIAKVKREEYNKLMDNMKLAGI